jgi:hypothetical protein
MTNEWESLQLSCTHLQMTKNASDEFCFCFNTSVDSRILRWATPKLSLGLIKRVDPLDASKNNHVLCELVLIFSGQCARKNFSQLKTQNGITHKINPWDCTFRSILARFSSLIECNTKVVFCEPRQLHIWKDDWQEVWIYFVGAHRTSIFVEPASRRAPSLSDRFVFTFGSLLEYKLGNY